LADNKKSTEEQIQELIDGYIDRYCRKEGCSRKEAKEHMMVKLVSEYYHDNPPKSGDENNLPRTELDIGCKGGC